MLLKFTQTTFGINEPEYNNTVVKKATKDNGNKYYYTKAHIGDLLYQYEAEEIMPNHWDGAYKLVNAEGVAEIGMKNVVSNAKKMLNSYLYMLTILDEIPEAKDIETFTINPINNRRVISIFRRVMKAPYSEAALEIEHTYGYRYKGEKNSAAGVKFLFEKVKNVESPIKPYVAQ